MEPSTAAPAETPQRRSFKDALKSPVSAAPTTSAPATAAAAEPSPLPASSSATSTVATKSSKTRATPAKNGTAAGNGGGPPARTVNGDGATAAAGEPKPKRIFAVLPVKKVKKGGRVAMRAENEAAAAEAAREAGKKAAAQKKAKKLKKDAALAEAELGQEEEEDRVVVPFPYQRPKPRVLAEDALFLWEEVAAFSEPRTVLTLEHLCQDVAVRLQQSRKANRLMQRYWNAQWARMVWEDEKISTEKRLLTPSSLTRTEGKINWKKMYKEEYPLWLRRTYTGVGSNNNATNVAKVMFRRSILNEKKSAAELARIELTVEESLLKAQLKRGVEVEVNNADGDDTDSVEGAAHPKRAGGGGSGPSGGPAGKGPRIRVPVHDPSTGFSRADYKQNYRQGTRKGKHMKGGDKKWGSYANFEDDDDMY